MTSRILQPSLKGGWALRANQVSGPVELAWVWGVALSFVGTLNYYQKGRV